MKGLKIAVLGAGPIGNLVAQTALGMGAESVLITDISGLRLEKAKECGIKHTADTKEEDFGEAMIRVFGPDKADVIYDLSLIHILIILICACLAKMINASAQWIKRKGEIRL